MSNRLFGVGGLLGPPAPGMGGTFNSLAQMGAVMASQNPANAMADLGNMNIRGQRLYQNLLMQAMQQAALQQHRAAQRQMEAERIGIQREGLGLREDELALAQQQFEQAPADVRQMQWALGLPEGPEKDAVMRAMNMTPALPKTGDVASLRKEYQAASRPWTDIRAAYERIEAAEETGAGDLALLYSYMKILDPTSVVRESEFAEAARAGGLPDQIQGYANSVISGERLTPEVREQIKSQARGLLAAPLAHQRARELEYQTIAERQGMNVDNVVRDLLGDYRDIGFDGVTIQREGAPTGGAEAAGDAGLPRPTNQAEYDELPVGTEYIAPNGQRLRKR